LKTQLSFNRIVTKVGADYNASARNLLHYLALRHYDLRDFQQELSSFGLSSLGRMEANTLAGLNAVLAVLHKMNGRTKARTIPAEEPVDFQTGPALLSTHTEALLGLAPKNRAVRIMVTMPSEAAIEYTLVRDLLNAGMDAMRINCAHDDTTAWHSMVENLRRAEKEVGRRCRILMDLAGPKLRTGRIGAVNHVVHWRPIRDVGGAVIAPARVWLSSSSRPDTPCGEYVHLPVDNELIEHARKGDTIP
jgi:pyruvate kinase